jgi:hypothetical protein
MRRQVRVIHVICNGFGFILIKGTFFKQETIRWSAQSSTTQQDASSLTEVLLLVPALFMRRQFTKIRSTTSDLIRISFRRD